MRLKLVRHAQTLPLATPENEGFDLRAVHALLRRLEALGVPSEVVDTLTMSAEERTQLYLEAALPAARRKYRVRQVFGSKRHAGSLFAQGVPALLVYESGTPAPIDVYPHRHGARMVTIRMFLENLLKTRQRAGPALELRKPDDALVARMDRLRKKIGPIGVAVAQLVREGRRR